MTSPQRFQQKTSIPRAGVIQRVNVHTDFNQTEPVEERPSHASLSTASRAERLQDLGADPPALCVLGSVSWFDNKTLDNVFPPYFARNSHPIYLLPLSNDFRKMSWADLFFFSPLVLRGHCFKDTQTLPLKVLCPLLVRFPRIVSPSVVFLKLFFFLSQPKDFTLCDFIQSKGAFHLVTCVLTLLGEPESEDGSRRTWPDIHEKL